MTHWAELTPRGAGGVTVLGVFGEGALATVQACAPNAHLRVGRPVLARLVVEGEWLDEALVVAHDAVRVEVHVHGSPPLVRRLGALFGGGDRRVRAVGAPAGESPTSEGENAQRAWSLLARATCDAAARMLLDQAEGALERELARIADLALTDQEEAQRALDERSRLARHLVDPPRVVLAGPVNAGKSTLFNALLGARRAITSDEAGTTRDLLREPALVGEWPVLLVDSAGERAREAAHEVEREGQGLGRAERRRAALTIWLQPPGAVDPPPVAAGERRVVLASRGDLPAAPPDALRPLEDPAAARERVRAVVHEALGLPARAWVAGAGVRLAADDA